MKSDVIAKLRDTLADIESENDAHLNDSFAGASISDHEELVLKLNAAAGVSLCKSILDLIVSDIDGKHQHFDELNFIDEGSAKFVIVYSKGD